MSKSSAKRETPQVTRSYTIEARHVDTVATFAEAEEVSRSEALRAILDDYAAEVGRPEDDWEEPKRCPLEEGRRIASFVLDKHYVGLIEGYARAWGVNRSEALRIILDDRAMQS